MAASERWIRDGGRVCLDFVNTLRDRWREPRETLNAPDDLASWLRGSGLLACGPATDLREPTLESARRLRAAIDRTVIAAARDEVPAGEDIALINSTATAAPRPAPRLVITAGRLEALSEGDRAGDAAAALGLLAQDTIALVASPEGRRVRVCAAERCALRFLDRSPAHNRRWCSMARCGNRAKARLHHARGREPSAGTGEA